MIAVLAGRRIDAEDAETARFPVAMKDIVYERIKDFFREYNIKVLVSSAACGADLLAHKAAREVNVEPHIILPFGREKFKETSVTDRPGDWGDLFDEICDRAERMGNLTIFKGFENDEEKAYSAVTTELFKYAENLQTEKEKLLAVAVWEGKPKNHEDETENFKKTAHSLKIKVKGVSTI